MDRKTLNEKMRELAQLEMMKVELDAEINALREEFKQMMIDENTDTLIGDEHQATYKSVESRRFDSAAFKKDHADMYEAYRKASASMRFTFA